MKHENYENLNELIQNRIFHHFDRICQIPHQSFKEEKLSKFLLDWASSLNLNATQDGKNNLLIKKPASSGFEHKNPIILQAHIDMVCEKSENSNHNFDTDPIEIQLDGDIISTGGKTTLGADNGIGVAIAMAILEDNNLQHPEVHVIFTTAEEEDMSGALSISKDWLQSNTIINLDNASDREVVVGSAGGMGVELKIPLEYMNPMDKWASYKIEIDGLTGGHSGEDINKGLAHANIMMGRILNTLRSEFVFNICEIKGGNFRLAIPRTSSVVISTDILNHEKIISSVKNLEEKWKQLHKMTDENLKLSVTTVENPIKVLTKVSTNKVIDTILLSPNGINNMIGQLGVVESSCNLGEIFIKENIAHLITEIRATYNTNREYLYEKIKVIAELFGGQANSFAKYPSWEYKETSKLREIIEATYHELYKDVMKVLVVHAGLECGCFSDKVDDMDAISIGPNTWNLHSPKESLSVSSTNKIYELLIETLKNL